MRGEVQITGDPALWRSQPLIVKRIGTFPHDVPLVGECMTQLPSAWPYLGISPSCYIPRIPRRSSLTITSCAKIPQGIQSGACGGEDGSPHLSIFTFHGLVPSQPMSAWPSSSQVHSNSNKNLNLDPCFVAFTMHILPHLYPEWYPMINRTCRRLDFRYSEHPIVIILTRWILGEFLTVTKFWLEATTPCSFRIYGILYDATWQPIINLE